MGTSGQSSLIIMSMHRRWISPVAMQTRRMEEEKGKELEHTPSSEVEQKVVSQASPIPFRSADRFQRD